MIFNYRILGLVSVISLILYGFFNLAFYSLIPVTLTLPGISGLILSIGMAVDANILIFERIREELRNGNTLKGQLIVVFKEQIRRLLMDILQPY